MKKFPTLYHKTSKGNINTWDVWADGDSVYTRWGKQDGKMQESAKQVTEKNVGRANATSLKEQAEFEAQAMWTHKKERKYSETIEETDETLFLPMLAKKFEDRKRFLTDDDYPCHGQPKFDGVRCIAHWKDGEVHLMSRGGKEYILPHISEELEKSGLPKKALLDGELYMHDIPLQELNRLVRGSHKYPEESIHVEYHVYDYPEENVEWKRRHENLSNFFEQNKGKLRMVKLVGNTLLKSQDDVYQYHAKCRAAHYEGSIVRLMNGLYKFGYRSAELLKVKSFQDEEFEIVGFTSGVGKFKDCVIYECQNESKTGGANGDGTFKVVPKGTFEERAVWFKEAKTVIGRMLKVEFAEYTMDLIPQFPIGICIRLEEDMDPKKKTKKKGNGKSRDKK